MKRAVAWVVVAGVVVALVVVMRQQGPKAATVSKTSVATAAPSVFKNASAPPASALAQLPAAGEKIVHTFSDDSQIQDFLKLFQLRQATVLREAMLQGYLTGEQANLNKIHDEITKQYGLDLSKAYTLNTAQRTVVENPPLAPPGEGAAPAAGSEAATPKVAYTFPDDEAVKTFSKQWQQRQAASVRIAVLQAYLSQERGNLTQLDDKFKTMYQVDITKNFNLNRQRRVLIELEQPPAPAGGDATASTTPLTPLSVGREPAKGTAATGQASTPASSPSQNK